MGESSANSAVVWRCERTCAEDSSAESGFTRASTGPAGGLIGLTPPAGLNGPWTVPLGLYRKIPFASFVGRDLSSIGENSAVHSQVVDSLRGLCWGLAVSKVSDASNQLGRCLALTQQTPGSLEVAHVLSTLGCQLNTCGKHREAEQAHRRALSIAATRLGADHLELSYCLDWLGLSLFLQGNFTEALLICYSTKAIVEKHLGREHPNVCGCLLNMASVYEVMGWFLYARQMREDAMAQLAALQTNLWK